MVVQANIMIKQYIVLVLALLFVPVVAQAGVYVISPDSDMVGEVQKYTVQKGDDFASIARKFDLGWLELQKSNPKVNPDKLAVGTVLIIPTEFILPNVPREGIVLNLAELRVYYYEPNSDVVVTHPVGLGQQGWKTPIGETTIVRKRENPSWTPPPSIRAEAAARGRTLPSVVPGGPNNPLGLYAMNLGWHGYLMHGTNAPSSIGQRKSHGCIRMYAEDIEDLFKRVPVGTKVMFIHEPFKVGVKGSELYLEAHEPFPEQYYNAKNHSEERMLQEAVLDNPYPAEDTVNWSVAAELIDYTYGYPVLITNIDDVTTPIILTPVF